MKATRQAPADQLPLIMAGLAGLGLAISIYLTIVHYSNVPLVCLGTSGCEEVNRSIYSKVMGVSVALLGAGAYVVLLGTLWAERQEILKPREAALVLFGVALAGTLYSAYLTYVEVFVIYAICIWCVISAVALAAILALAIVRLRQLLGAEAALPGGARAAVKSVAAAPAPAREAAGPAAGPEDGRETQGAAEGVRKTRKAGKKGKGGKKRR
jgi:uncharacterized membrane protein